MGTLKRSDLHVHTSHSGWRRLGPIDPQDCYVTPEIAYEEALRRGMDYVCLTDHDTIDGALELLSRRPEAAERVIVGEEVEARFPDRPFWIHVGVLDVDEQLHEDMARLRGDCLELLAELSRRRKLFTLNHPFQSFRSVRSARRCLSDVLPLVPAVEASNGASPPSHRIVLEAMLGDCGSAPGWVLVGGSDAHTRRRIGTVFTAAPGDTKDEFLANVAAGRAEVHGIPAGLPALVRDVYSVVGSYYRQLYGRDYPRSGARRARNVLSSTLLLPAVVGGLPAALTALHWLRQEWIARLGGWERFEATSRLRGAPLSAPISEPLPTTARARP